MSDISTVEEFISGGDSHVFEIQTCKGTYMRKELRPDTPASWMLLDVRDDLNSVLSRAGDIKALLDFISNKLGNFFIKPEVILSDHEFNNSKITFIQRKIKGKVFEASEANLLQEKLEQLGFFSRLEELFSDESLEELKLKLNLDFYNIFLTKFKSGRVPDLHPGNFIEQSDGQIVMVDF